MSEEWRDGLAAFGKSALYFLVPWLIVISVTQPWADDAEHNNPQPGETWEHNRPEAERPMTGIELHCVVR